MDHGIAVAGSYVADSLASVHAGGVRSDGLGPSQGGGPLLCTLREFVGVASPSVDPVGLCSVDGLGSLGFFSGVSSAVPSFSSGPSLFPSSSGVTSQRLPCLSLLLVSLFPRPFLPFLSGISLPPPGFSGTPPVVSLFSGSSLAPVTSLPSFPSLAPQVTSLSHLISDLLAPVLSSSLCVGSSPFPVASSSLSVVSSSLVLFVASSLVPGVASTSSADVTSCSFSTGSLLSVVVCSAPSAPSFPPPASFLPSFLVAGSVFFFCQSCCFHGGSSSCSPWGLLIISWTWR